MPRTNPKNDRVKREYLIYLKDARQRSTATVDQVRHAIDRLESYTGFKDFCTFNKEQARGFKQALVATKEQRPNRPISTATAHHILQALKEFLAWLQGDLGSKMIHPAPDGLVGDHDAPFRQQIFDVAEAQGEPDIEPVQDIGPAEVA